MVVKWLSCRKFEARVLVKRLEGLGCQDEMMMGRLTAEIKWRGPKIRGLSSLRGVKKNQTRGGVFDSNGVLQWNEEFRNICSFLGFMENGLRSWDVVITVLNGSNSDLKTKDLVVGTTSLNFGEYISSSNFNVVDIIVPLTLADGSKECSPFLAMSLSLRELKCAADVVEISSSPCKSTSSPEKERVDTLQNRKKKGNIFKRCMTPRKLGTSESNGRKYDSDTESSEDWCEEGFDDAGEEEINMLQQLSYGPLTFVNFGHAISSYSGDDEDSIYYSNRRLHIESSSDSNVSTSATDPSMRQNSKHRFLSWRKRKLGFISPRQKGEPLLKKDCRDEGGDDIDYDRRQLTSSDESSFGWSKTEYGSSFSEFEDEGFSVGAWERKDITCRDGHLKLETQVFFASMDQRSERAAGESACTALVAVIAEWLHSNRCEMPIKSEFDRLIRDGSSEWRNLCENQAYMERFPDKHFDLETVLEAKIRPLSVVPEKSFIGFFHPEGIVEESSFDILQGSMSFDEIWDEVSRQAIDAGTPLVYIVSWNDHFFVLKVEEDACYIIDTLGERLYEGCNQAYILKFDRHATIKQIPSETSPNGPLQDSQPNKKSEDCGDLVENTAMVEVQGSALAEKEDLVWCGKESCKKYIKRFLTGIPIRQLQEDIKKGLSSVSIHQRLQIEFHFTDILP